MQPFQRLFSFFSSVRGSVSKNCSVTPILPFLFLLGSVAWVSPAGFAASFDCTKAGAAIEKMICADPAISKLDEDLAAAYRDVLATTPDKAAFKRQQREWLAQSRDRCVDQACLKAAYQQRLTRMKASPGKQGAGAVITADRKYPPYPEVWGMDVGDSGPDKPKIAGIFYARNGDILVRLAKVPNDPNLWATNKEQWCTQSAFLYREFFALGGHALSCDEFNAFERRPDILPPPGPKYMNDKVPFSDGSTLQYLGGASTGCNDPFPGQYILRDPRGRAVVTKSIFVRLPKPESMSCRFEPDMYSISVDTRGSSVHMLPDDTFLVLVAGRYLIRFDKNFNTHFPYDRNNVFIIDRSAVTDARKRAEARCPSDPLGCVDAEMWKYLNSLSQ